MKDNVTIQQIKMQARFLNELLDKRDTATVKIQIESIMLTDLLKKFNLRTTTASKEEIESIYQTLKKAKKYLEDKGIFGGNEDEE